MRFFAALAALAAAAVCASAQAVRQPWLSVALFGYPSADFNNLYTAIKAHPEITFEIIVNPSNGPGSVNNTGLPDVNWQSTVRKLKSYPNTVLVGYTRTKWTYGNRDPTQNNADIDIYNMWGVKDPSLALDGVFLDDCPWQLELLPTWQAFGDRIHNGTGWRKEGPWFNSPSYRNGMCYFNPGSPTSPEYYAPADRIMTQEVSYDYAPLEWLFRAPNAPREKQCVLNYYQRNTFDANLARNVANSFVGANLGSYSLYPIGLDYSYNVINSSFPSAVDLVAKSFAFYNDPNMLYSGCGQARF